MLNKKGISPLIATVLIIGFTVALAAVIMAWGQGFIKGMTESAETSANTDIACSQDVKLDVSYACVQQVGGVWGGVDDIIKITDKNNAGTRDIKNMTARGYWSQNEIASVSVGGLAATQVSTVSKTSANLVPPTGLTFQTLKQLEVIPIIEIAGKDVTCTQATVNYPLGALPSETLPLC